MKQLINKINQFIDNKISNNITIMIFSIVILTYGRYTNIITFIIFFITYMLTVKKIDRLALKNYLLEFEKRNMLLALSDEDSELKEYLESRNK